MMREVAIGIDIGGTNIKAGIMSKEGEILREETLPTEANGGKEQLLKKIERIVKEYAGSISATEFKLAGVGIGTAGYVNLAGEIGSATDNLPGWKGTRLKEEMEANLSLPVKVDNDVNAIAMGELWLGAGRVYNDFLCIALGTGIGGCLVSEGKPYRGRNGYAGAYGHQIIQFGGQPCNCGLKGCWEQYASITALKRMMSETDRTAEVWGNSPIQLFASAKEGNRDAVQIINCYAEHVAIGMANLIHSFNPSAIIIGGAVTEQGDFLFDQIRSFVHKHTMSGFATEPDLPIVPARLGNMAGMIGSAKLVWESV